MILRQRFLVAAFLPVSLVAMISAATIRHSSFQLGPQVISQPSGWAAFEADFIQTQQGAPNFVGHYSRGSDASFRVDQQTEDGSLRMISIANVPRGFGYIYHSGPNLWIRRHLILPADGLLKIYQRREGDSGLTPSQTRIEGFAVYQYQEGDGTTHLQAPALNFFSLVMQSAKTGVRRVFSNVVVREPSRSLFEPPIGVHLQDDPKPMPYGAN